MLAVTGGERSENTHGKALATLFRLPASEAGAAATIQQAALAILLELVIVACFVAFELLGREVNGRRSADAVIEPTLAAPVGVQLLAPLKLVDSSAVPVGKVSRFFLEETVRGSNARLSMTAALTAYRAWSDDKGLQPVATINFVEAMTIVYREGSIDNVVEGGDIVAVGVKLKTATRPSLRNYQRSPTARLLPQSTL